MPLPIYVKHGGELQIIRASFVMDASDDFSGISSHIVCVIRERLSIGNLCHTEDEHESCSEVEFKRLFRREVFGGVVVWLGLAGDGVIVPRLAPAARGGELEDGRRTIAIERGPRKDDRLTQRSRRIVAKLFAQVLDGLTPPCRDFRGTRRWIGIIHAI